MWTTEHWQDYELLDTSDGERLERWGKYILIRPDPQVIWHDQRKSKMWRQADAVYRRSTSGGMPSGAVPHEPDSPVDCPCELRTV